MNSLIYTCCEQFDKGLFGEASVSTDMEVSVEARKILSHLYIMANELELAENLIKETLLKVDESSNLTLS